MFPSHSSLRNFYKTSWHMSAVSSWGPKIFKKSKKSDFEMSPQKSLEHIFCVKNAHGLENDTYSNLGDLLPAENRPIRWVARFKILLKTLDIFEISVEGSMLAVEVCSGFPSLVPTIPRRFPPVSLKNIFSRGSFCFAVSNQEMKSGHNANFTAKMVWEAK